VVVVAGGGSVDDTRVTLVVVVDDDGGVADGVGDEHPATVANDSAATASKSRRAPGPTPGWLKS
jgi:hypothetical protein